MMAAAVSVCTVGCVSPLPTTSGNPEITVNKPVAVTRKSSGHELRVDAMSPIARHILDHQAELLRQVCARARRNGRFRSSAHDHRLKAYSRSRLPTRQCRWPDK